MITLVLPADIAARLREALMHAGLREIGGVMMAEHTSLNEFVVREISIHRRGTLASFLRRIEDALSTLRRFFERTARDYRHFNYIGEWHSHPSFEPIPSPRDHQSMREIIRDPSVGANFVALLIVKIAGTGELIGSVHVYQPDGVPHGSRLVVE